MLILKSKMDMPLRENMTLRNNINTDNPLVSIIVITYNSSKYVLETLESIKDQTYQNIELIVSDDCSTDNSVEICRKWIEEYHARFVNSKLLTIERNTGVSANCNRGVNASQGEWIKFIAGDDNLLKNCISDNILFIQQNQKIKILFSGIKVFYENSSLSYEVTNEHASSFYEKPAEEQFRQLIIKNMVTAPSAFINFLVIQNVKGYDERIKNLEDHPFWLKATNAGYKLFYMPVITVRYRVHSESLNYNSSPEKLYNEFLKTFYLYQLPNISFRNFLHIWHIFLSLHTSRHKNLRFLKIFSPAWYYLKIGHIKRK